MVYTNYPTTDILPYDIMLMVFSYLDVAELLSCEKVCRKWQLVVSSINWKKVLERQIHLYPAWREMVTFQNTRIESEKSHKFVCQNLHRKIQKLDQNWRKKRCYKQVKQMYFPHGSLHMDGDFMVFQDRYYAEGGKFICSVVDGVTGKVLHKIGMPTDSVTYHILQNNLVILENSTSLCLFDAATGKKVLQVKKTEQVTCVAFKAGILAVSSRLRNGGSVLRLWKRKAFDRFDFIYQHSFEGYVPRLDMDDLYIAVYEEKRDSDGSAIEPLQFNMQFITLKNLTVEQGPIVAQRYSAFYYNQGIFFHIETKIGIIKLVEVSTKRLLRSIETDLFSDTGIYGFVPLKVNSKFMVTWNTAEVCIYDLNAAKDPFVNTSNLLLNSFHVKGFYPTHFELNEREIRAIGLGRVNMDMMSLDFTKKL